MFNLRVLVADDQLHVRNLIEARLKRCGQGTFTTLPTLTDSAEGAVKLVRDDPRFDLVLLDIDYRESDSSQGMTGHEAATKIRAMLPRARIILVSALGGVEHQVLAHKNPCVDRMLSRTDFSDETLRHLCIWASLTRLHDENRLVGEELRILTRSSTMRRYLDHLDRIRAESNVVVYGETGTGKELSARRLNANARFSSNQPSRNFAALNCGQLTESLIEAKLLPAPTKQHSDFLMPPKTETSSWMNSKMPRLNFSTFSCVQFKKNHTRRSEPNGQRLLKCESSRLSTKTCLT